MWTKKDIRFIIGPAFYYHSHNKGLSEKKGVLLLASSASGLVPIDQLAGRRKTKQQDSGLIKNKCIPVLRVEHRFLQHKDYR